jgi:rhodanese-related sulfurtransferase
MDTVISSITVPTLRSQIGRANAPFVIDVRRKQAFDADPRMIASATWRDPFAIGDWLKFLPRHRDIVVYCVHGHEISKNACAAIVAAGLTAHVLEGGIEAWTASGGATLLKQPVLSIPSPTSAPSKWVTRARPKIDRIACPWLIRRFIDPAAEFLYVPAAEVMATASAENAIAYDVPGVRFTHRGDDCSFDALLADFELNDPVLHDLATIVRGADTGHPELTPQSHGLLAVSLGLSALYADDHEMLRHGMVVYDALYAWLKSARAEVHNADLFKKKA